jgi:hypothetical protein
MQTLFALVLTVGLTNGDFQMLLSVFTTTCSNAKPPQ